VLLGDKVMLSDPSDPHGPVYEGFVHEVKHLHRGWRFCIMTTPHIVPLFINVDLRILSCRTVSQEFHIINVIHYVIETS
jgi:hypothetical protein